MFIHQTLKQIQRDYDALHPETGSFSRQLFYNVNGNIKTNIYNTRNISIETVFGFSDIILADMFIRKYDEYLCYRYYDNTTVGTLEMLNDMHDKLLQVVLRNIPKYVSMLYAITADYNPLHNYDMTEIFIQGEKNGTETQITEQLQGHKSSQTTTVLQGSKTVTTEKNNPYDNGGYADTTQTTVDQTQSLPKTETVTDDTLSLPKTQTDVSHTVHVNDTNGGISYTDQDRTQKHTLNRAGNIGVTTSTQLLTDYVRMLSDSVIGTLFDDIKKEILLSIF